MLTATHNGFKEVSLGVKARATGKRKQKSRKKSADMAFLSAKSLCRYLPYTPSALRFADDKVYLDKRLGLKKRVLGKFAYPAFLKKNRYGWNSSGDNTKFLGFKKKLSRFWNK